MDVIRRYPPIYDKSCKGFQDRRVKANCWKKISDELKYTVEEAERRYKSIPTAFSRYLSKVKGRSGAGSTDVGPVDSRSGHMRWLISFIKSRQSCSNVSTKIARPHDDEGSQGFVTNGPKGTATTSTSNSCE